MKKTRQTNPIEQEQTDDSSTERFWAGDFGKEYTDRNNTTPEETDEIYRNTYGVSRTELNNEFLRDVINKDSKILEVGCNIGIQLRLLQKMNYTTLWGIELQQYAAEIARRQTKEINIVKGSGFDIPFKDNYFDLVFTSGVLIHISPQDIKKILNEMYRCTHTYIWGFEYYIPKGYQMVKYRGNENVLWKTDFAQLFLDNFPKLTLVKKKIVKYRMNENLDIMYLLKKED